MQKNTKIIHKKSSIFQLYAESDDKADFIELLLNSQTFDFKKVDDQGYTFLIKLVISKYNYNITRELL